MEYDNYHENIVPTEIGEVTDITASAMTGLAILTERVDQLAYLYERLLQENQELREQNSALQTERDALREKHEQARARIEAMVIRLKTLEQTP